MAVIVYLDQSIISNLVKYKRGQVRTPEAGDLYKQLDSTIQRCNRKGCHVFPESPHHMDEADFDSRLSEDEWRYLKDISRGLEFEQPKRIVDVQMQCALDQWLHNDQQQRINWKNSWEGIFNRDPHKPFTRDPYQFYVRFRSSHVLLEHDRAYKARLAEKLAEFMPVTSRKTLAEQTELERKEVIRQLFVPSKLNVSNISASIDLFVDLLIPNEHDGKPDVSDKSIDEIVRMVDNTEVWSRLEYLKRRGLSPIAAGCFLQSQELASIPMVDIWAKLWGHLMTNAAMRVPGIGDRSDIEIMAMTLPYCDIVTTDSFMQKIVVEDIKLADLYHALVLSAKLKDVKELIAILAN